jgi:hypothetical protein
MGEESRSGLGVQGHGQSQSHLLFQLVLVVKWESEVA